MFKITVPRQFIFYLIQQKIVHWLLIIGLLDDFFDVGGLAILASISTRVKNSFNTNTGHCDTKNIFANYWILLSDNLPIFEKSFSVGASSISQVAFHLILLQLESFTGIIVRVISIEDGIQILIKYKLLVKVCSSSSFN